MSETLYRKYRPQNFSEMIGQEHIVRTLSNSIQNGRVVQAYLFTGPRGTGKTTLARIFAKRINCEKSSKQDPCEKCHSCEIISSGKSLDIIEIDAASNTGVDNIRELRETVALAPASLKYKIYIIDEVHMLSQGAWNALLKTLEEPPAHVIFILATTEIHKVPETILSRCQRFDFSRFPIGDIVKKLSFIAKKEKVEIEKEALEIIALSAEGGMRDAESTLGQIMSLEDKKITARETQEILGTAGKSVARDFARLVLEKNSTKAIEKINELLEDGYDLEVFTKSVVNYLRQLMLFKISSDLEKYFSFEMTKEETKKALEIAKASEMENILLFLNLLLKAQGEISSSVLPQLPLEIAVIRATGTFPHAKEQEPTNINQKVKKEASPVMAIDLPIAKKNEPENKKETIESENGGKITLEDVNSRWKQLLVDIRPYNHSLSALLLNCQPTKVEGNLLTLATPYDFYCERLAEDKNRLTVEEVFSKILGAKIMIRVALDRTLCAKKDPADDQPIACQQNPLLDSALEIMGGKIVE